MSEVQELGDVPGVTTEAEDQFDTLRCLLIGMGPNAVGPILIEPTIEVRGLEKMNEFDFRIGAVRAVGPKVGHEAAGGRWRGTELFRVHAEQPD